MNSCLKVIVVLAIVRICFVNSKKNGFPCSVQNSMVPPNYGPPQFVDENHPPPFNFYVLDSFGQQVKFYKQDIYTIRLNGSAYFRRFLIQARPSTEDGKVTTNVRSGEFIVEPELWDKQGIEILQCPSALNDSITHTNGRKKSSLDVKWTIRRNDGSLQFLITIIEEANVYWVQWAPKSGLIFPLKEAQFSGFGDQQRKRISVSNDDFFRNEVRFLSSKHVAKIEAQNKNNSNNQQDSEKEFLFNINQNNPAVSGIDNQDSREPNVEVGPERQQVPTILSLWAKGSEDEDETTMTSTTTTTTSTTTTTTELLTTTSSSTVSTTSESLGTSSTSSFETATVEMSPSETIESLVFIPETTANESTSVQTTRKSTAETQPSSKKTTLKVTNVSTKPTASKVSGQTDSVKSSTTTKPKVTFTVSNRATTKIKSTVSSGAHNMTEDHNLTISQGNASMEMNENHTNASVNDSTLITDVAHNMSEVHNLTINQGNASIQMSDNHTNASVNDSLLITDVPHNMSEDYNLTVSQGNVSNVNDSYLITEEMRLSNTSVNDNVTDLHVKNKTALEMEINADIEEILNSTMNQTEVEALHFYLNISQHANETMTNDSKSLKAAVKFIESFNNNLMDKKKKSKSKNSSVETHSSKNTLIENEMNVSDNSENETQNSTFVDFHNETMEINNITTADSLEDIVTSIAEGNATEINECESSPCFNNATCVSQPSGYTCLCGDGYMGVLCQRPCQDMYLSCQTWQEEGKCDSMRVLTKFYDVNCAASCEQCVVVNSTIRTETPLPPVLEPFHQFLGTWSINYPGRKRFPLDFDEAPRGYYEEISFFVPSLTMFGTPFINFTAVAVNNNDPNDAQSNAGFMTLKPFSQPTNISIISTGNDGVTIIEEGVLNDHEMSLVGEFFYVHPLLQPKLPKEIQRSFKVVGEFLEEHVERKNEDGQADKFMKIYRRERAYVVY